MQPFVTMEWHMSFECHAFCLSCSEPAISRGHCSVGLPQHSTFHDGVNVKTTETHCLWVRDQDGGAEQSGEALFSEVSSMGPPVQQSWFKPLYKGPNPTPEQAALMTLSPTQHLGPETSA